MDSGKGISSTVEAQHDHAIMSETKRKHFGARMVFSVLIMCLGTTTYSYGAGVIATTVGQPSWYEYFGLTSASGSYVGATTGLYYAGGVFGALCANYVADCWGRKASLYAGTATSLVGAALTAGSVHIGMFVAFRFLMGFGGFMLLMTVPLWITEVVPAEVRGSFAQFHGVCTSLGYLISSYVGVGFFVNSVGINTWRYPIAIGGALPLLFLCGLWWLPESPRYLLMRGRVEEAQNIVRKFHSAQTDDVDRYVEAELFQMRSQIDLDRTLPTSWLYLLKKPSMRKRIIMTMYIPCAGLATGNLSIATYFAIILAQTGWSPLLQLNIQAGLQVAVMPGLCAAIFFTEKFRRPTMFTIGLIGMTATLSIYAAINASLDLIAGGHRHAQIAAVAILYLNGMWGCAWIEGPIAYWGAEFWPTHLRARGQTISIVSYGLSSILWGQSTPTAVTNIGWKLFLVFICVSLVNAALFYFYYPDTQGRTLEEVALLFGDDDLVVVCQQDIQITATEKGPQHVIIENCADTKAWPKETT